ncbi:MAG: hypothetical protein D6785_16345 [Planctomycetota bacterium]|nr:MAG: hypothetical protein D6785_16345 [Planctomycetota bacterium]
MAVTKLSDLTQTQREILEQMEEGVWYHSEELKVPKSTLNRLVIEGLANAKVKNYELHYSISRKGSRIKKFSEMGV